MGIKIDDILGNRNNNILEDKSKKTINRLIILIVIIVIIIVFLAFKMIKENSNYQAKEALSSKLLDAQRLTNVVANAYTDYLNNGTPLIGRKLSVSNSESIKFDGTTINFENGYYYVSKDDTSKFSQLTLSNNNINYIVNYATGEVINQNGVEYKGKKYYFYDDLYAIKNLLDGKDTYIPSDYTIFIGSAKDMNKIIEKPQYLFKLISNIDMSGVEWPNVTLEGEFNGRNYTIQNLKINRPSDTKVGLFSTIASGATVSNLKLENVDINGGKYTGAIAGVLEENGTVNNCNVLSGKVASSDSCAGGMFGQSNGNVSKAIASCEVISDGRNVGGFAGEITGGTYKMVGAKVNTSDMVTVRGAYNVGGLAGLVNALKNIKMEECFAYGQLYGGVKDRGVIGELDIVEKDFNYNVGGFIGTIEKHKSGVSVEIDNAYTRSKVNEGDKNIGGFVGRVYLEGVGSSLKLAHIYSVADITTECDDVDSRGGFAGYYYLDKNSATVQGVYWKRDEYADADLDSSGVGKPLDSRKMSMTIFEPRTPNTLQGNNPFDKDAVWDSNTLIKWKFGSGYPTLRWEEEI